MTFAAKPVALVHILVSKLFIVNTFEEQFQVDEWFLPKNPCRLHSLYKSFHTTCSYYVQYFVSMRIAIDNDTVVDALVR